VPFFKTPGKPLRTQYCDTPGRFSRQAPLTGSLCITHAAPSSFQPVRFGLCWASVPGSRIVRACGKLSISHSRSPLRQEPQSGNLMIGLIPVADSPQSASHLQTWKLTLAYDGTDFRGWQVQPGEVTIQGELQAALGRITGESPLPQGSGRTDAGVHALAQVASFALQAPIPPANLLRALNRTLPPSKFWMRERYEVHSMHGIPRWPKPTSIGFSVGISARLSLRATFTLAPGQWTWQPCKCQPVSLRANTTF